MRYMIWFVIKVCCSNLLFYVLVLGYKICIFMFLINLIEIFIKGNVFQGKMNNYLFNKNFGLIFIIQICYVIGNVIDILVYYLLMFIGQCSVVIMVNGSFEFVQKCCRKFVIERLWE